MCRPREVLVRSMRQILGIHRRNLVGVCRLLLVREVGSFQVMVPGWAGMV